MKQYPIMANVGSPMYQIPNHSVSAFVSIVLSSIDK